MVGTARHIGGEQQGPGHEAGGACEKELCPSFRALVSAALHGIGIDCGGGDELCKAAREQGSLSGRQVVPALPGGSFLRSGAPSGALEDLVPGRQVP